MGHYFLDKRDATNHKQSQGVGRGGLRGSSRRERGILHHHQPAHHTKPDTGTGSAHVIFVIFLYCFFFNFLSFFPGK